MVLCERPVIVPSAGKRLGLQVTLSTAPLHVFVKYTDYESGATCNLEATSGAGFTRDAWYHAELPMTEATIANGVYLKTLSRKEALVVISTLVLDHLMKSGRYDEAIAVADVLLEAWPEYEYAQVKKGAAYYGLLNENIIKEISQAKRHPA